MKTYRVDVAGRADVDDARVEGPVERLEVLAVLLAARPLPLLRALSLAPLLDSAPSTSSHWLPHPQAPPLLPTTPPRYRTRLVHVQLELDRGLLRLRERLHVEAEVRQVPLEVRVHHLKTVISNSKITVYPEFQMHEKAGNPKTKKKRTASSSSYEYTSAEPFSSIVPSFTCKSQNIFYARNPMT